MAGFDVKCHSPPILSQRGFTVWLGVEFVNGVWVEGGGVVCGMIYFQSFSPLGGRITSSRVGLS